MIAPMPDVRTFNVDYRGGRYRVVKVRAGRCRQEEIVPPAGDAYAFVRDVWDHEIEVTVSPTGRSVQVFVDGEKVL